MEAHAPADLRDAVAPTPVAEGSFGLASADFEATSRSTAHWSGTRMNRLVVAALVVIAGCSQRSLTEHTATAAPETQAPAATSTEPSAPAPRPRDPPLYPAWVVIGAVTGPTMNQLSIEEEVAAVEDLLGADRGLLLYAGGPGSRGVLVSGRAADAPPVDPLFLLVGDLLGGANLRDSHYRPLSVNPHAPATEPKIRAALAGALDAPGDRLTIWLAGHGEQVEEPWDANVGTWGGATFDNATLQALLLSNKAGRPVHFIGTQCYGGGFADALVEASERACGAFAAVWIRPASGCDPDPTALRTSYGVHLRAALKGQAIAPDLDQNGVLGLSEAHVSAVLGLSGIDVPTLSSQYLLERAQGLSEIDEADPDADTSLPDSLFEEHHIVNTLLERLGLGLGVFDQAYDEAVLEAEAFDASHTFETKELDAAAADARGQVLARWPELEDPWHPDFTATFANNRATIARFFETSPEVALWLSEREEYSESDDLRYQHELKLRAIERAAINLRTLRFATKAFEKPALFERFWRLRDCERAPVAMRRP